MDKPSYKELAEKVRELKNESRERRRAEKKLLEKQSLLESQNIKLVLIGFQTRCQAKNKSFFIIHDQDIFHC